MDLGGRLDAVSARHDHVHDDDIRMKRSDLRDRLLPVARLADHLDPGLVVQQSAKALAQDPVVVDEQDPDARARVILHPLLLHHHSFAPACRGITTWTRVPWPTAVSMLSVPCSAAERSRIDIRPTP